MAITRKLVTITLTYTGSSVHAVHATAVVTDDVEGISDNVLRSINAPAVITAADALRDAVVTASANIGKPVTF